MGDIRILNDKFENNLKKAETSLDEFLQVCKGQNQLLIDIARTNLLKTFWELDLNQATAFRKFAELSLKVELKGTSDILAAKDLEELYRFKHFLQHLEQRFLAFAECKKATLFSKPLIMEVMQNISFKSFV